MATIAMVTVTKRNGLGKDETGRRSGTVWTDWPKRQYGRRRVVESETLTDICGAVEYVEYILSDYFA